jgi:beta-N-acetylhexosaminidase
MRRRAFLGSIGSAAATGAALTGCAVRPLPFPEDRIYLQKIFYGTDRGDSPWVHDLWRRMSIEDKVCQLIQSYVREPELGDLELKLAREGRLGSAWRPQWWPEHPPEQGQPGRTIEEIAAWGDRLRSGARFPLFFTSACEAGADFCDIATPTPPNMALGAAGPDEAAKIARIHAREFRALGIHQIGGPIVDPNTNPDNSIINYRSFGDDPVRVTAVADAYIRVAQKEGIAVTAALFPGHGGTSGNSHLMLPVNGRTRRELDETDLYPYRKLLSGGVSGVMTTHVLFSALDPEYPATLSKKILTGLLRGEMRYPGLVMTDDLAMRAVHEKYPLDRIVPLAINAGNDLLITTNAHELGDMTKIAVDGIRSGVISRDIVERAALRVIRHKDILRVQSPPPSIEEAKRIVGCAEHRNTAREVARRAVVIARAKGLPLKKSVATALVIISNGDNDGADLARAFGETVPPGMTFIPKPHETPELPTAIRGAANIVVVLQIRPIPWDPLAGLLPPSGKALLPRIQALRKNTVFLVMANPYAAREIPRAESLVFTFGVGEPCAMAGYCAVYGEFTPTGTPPVKIPGIL